MIAIGNDQVPPVWAAALRLVLASVILFVVMALTRVPLPRGPALRSAVLYGFFQFGVNFPLIYLGEKDVSSGMTAVIFATLPLSQSLLTRWTGLERLTVSKIVGALVALVGVALIFSSRATANTRPLGMLWVLLATWTGCIATVSLKLGPRQSAIGSNAVGAAVGLPVCVAWSFAIREAHPLHLSPAAFFPILYLAVAGSVVAFVVMAWLLNRWDVTQVSYIAVVVPVVALVLGTLVRHESVSRRSLIGAAVVLAGVVVGLDLWRPRGSSPRGHLELE